MAYKINYKAADDMNSGDAYSFDALNQKHEAFFKELKVFYKEVSNGTAEFSRRYQNRIYYIDITFNERDNLPDVITSVRVQLEPRRTVVSIREKSSGATIGRLFSKRELRFFDELGFETSEQHIKNTTQTIEEWF